MELKGKKVFFFKSFHIVVIYHFTIENLHKLLARSFLLVPPTIMESERVVQVKENATVTLECVANGNPKPMIAWKRDGQLLNTRDSRFVITSSKASDAGR